MSPALHPRPALRPVRVATPLALPSMRELSRISTHLLAAPDLISGATRLQSDLRALLQVTDALCVWIDWAHRSAWSVSGRLGEHLQELVTEVAGSGRRELINNTLIEPVGRSPARGVLALRRPAGSFSPTDLAMISTLVGGIAPALDRLISEALAPARPGPQARGSNR